LFWIDKLSFFSFVWVASGKPIIFFEVGVRVEADLNVAFDSVERNFFTILHILPVTAEQLRAPLLRRIPDLPALKLNNYLFASYVL